MRDFDEDVFSDSDIDCINEAIEKYGNLSFKEIRDISHDSVWMAANQNGEIPLEVIAASCKDGDKLIAYLTSAE